MIGFSHAFDYVNNYINLLVDSMIQIIFTYNKSKQYIAYYTGKVNCARQGVCTFKLDLGSIIYLPTITLIFIKYG